MDTLSFKEVLSLQCLSSFIFAHLTVAALIHVNEVYVEKIKNPPAMVLAQAKSS